MLVSVSRGYPPVSGKLLTRYAPFRRSPSMCIATHHDAPRLACVKPAASVHPEPGSNSSLYIFYLSKSSNPDTSFELTLLLYYLLAHPFQTTVEIVGVEPTTLCLQSRCSSQLSYTPLLLLGWQRYAFFIYLQIFFPNFFDFVRRLHVRQISGIGPERTNNGFFEKY